MNIRNKYCEEEAGGGHHAERYHVNIKLIQLGIHCLQVLDSSITYP